jgi:hypothetical protein
MTPKQEKIVVETFAIIASFIVALAIVLIIKSIVE